MIKNIFIVSVCIAPTFLLTITAFYSISHFITYYAKLQKFYGIFEKCLVFFTLDPDRFRYFRQVAFSVKI